MSVAFRTALLQALALPTDEPDPDSQVYERDNARQAAPEVGWAWRELCRTGGRTGVAALTAATGWSHRHLATRFRQQVGLSPKAFGRVLRFQRAVDLLRAPAPPALAEIAASCGYFDQAHLNRDFRELASSLYRPVKSGFRFSTNARRPSPASSEARAR